MPTCAICGDFATTADGMVRMYLCDKVECLSAAWDIAFPDKDGAA